ncbi:MAG TPA: hypothetical protein VF792_01460, partial [Ktedonobacterales bacterium]
MAEGTRPGKPTAEETAEPGFALDSREATPRSARQRVAAVAATALLVVAALVGLFVHATSDPGGAFDTLLQIYTPTPQPTFVPGANQIFIMRGVPWGALTIDGKKVPQNDASVKGILLTYGTHHLVYQARYFPTLRCVISAPSQPDDTCPVDSRQGESGQFIADHGLARMINLNLTSDKLQADQYSKLVQQINRTLSAKTYMATIAPGERYMDAQRSLVTASEPLTLRLSLHTLTASDVPAWGNVSCFQLCALAGLGNTTDIGQFDDQWRVDLQIGERWSLTDANGNTMPLIYQSLGDGFIQNTLHLGIKLNATTWSISGLDHPASDAISDNASMMLLTSVTPQTPSQPTASPSGFSPIVGANPVEGCVMELTFYDDLSSNVPTKAHVLLRFGAMVALDSAAHNHYPWLPAANSDEEDAANLIVQQAQG